MANLYRPRTIALAKMAALPRYRHPADLANEFKKPVSTQMREISGGFEFGKGLYHSERYERLVKGVTALNPQFLNARKVEERKEIAAKQFKLWEEYVQQGVNQLPQSKKITQKKRSQLFQTYTIAKQRSQQKIACHRMLIFHNEYSKAFKFDIEIHPRLLLQMIHPHFGYMLLFRKNITLDELIEFYHRALFASEQRYAGETLHSDEISAFNFWKLFSEESSLTVSKFCELLRCFKFGTTVEGFQREFAYTLGQAKGELSRDIAGREQVVRFGLFRQIFLERNL